MQIDNKGNLVTRRAFAERDGQRLGRVEVLALVTHRKMATAYQMTEEVGLYGSGRRSPLYVLCELIRALYEVETRTGAEFSGALELAEYPRSFLRQLRGEAPAAENAVCKLNFLIKNASDANYILGNRSLKDLTLGELKEFGQKIMNAQTLAHEISLIADGQIMAAERSYPGTPFERTKEATGR